MFMVSHLIPHLAKNELKVVEVYSPPPSVCKILRDFPVSFFAQAFQVLKAAKALSLVLQKLT